MLVFINCADRSLLFNGGKVNLSNKEYLLLVLLLKHRNKGVIDAESLSLHVWGGRYKGVAYNNISQLLYLLRKKLKKVDASISLNFYKDQGVQISIRRSVIFIKCHKFFFSIVERYIIKGNRS
ncbi:hypothetical protein GQQ23_19410 [Pantoea agglomerans]|uniref:winged helix-turn-helix domain-containing protein n=1 Tax=Enterobacter agglomerans TaxID=549 RepID=UPI0013C96D1B|nr:winged helix-turn-helix domain-containing protein [Pantoea agglomerans]NEG64484.1 hypothetical protein [Pantoea agglomerans]